MAATRFPWDLSPTDFARQQEAAEEAGRPLVDLTISNPPALGLGPGPEHFRDLAADALADHAPDPRGALATREAVAAYLAGHGSDLGPERILLCASTSEAYGWLFKVLAAPGEAIALPRPGYPLFDFLTHLEGLRPIAYDLFRDERWQLDRGSVEQVLGERPKALVVVQPSNPVGACLSDTDRDWLLERCGAAGVPLLVDEVFLDYAEAAGAHSLGRAETLARARELDLPLFLLSGASKVVAAPQVKLGWIALGGSVGDEQRARLELVADTYLSVSAAAQLLGARLLPRGATLRAPILERLAQSRARLETVVAEEDLLSLHSDPAGWSAVLRLPPCPTDEGDWSAHLLEAAGLLVHPGHFYELSARGVVISLLTDPVDLAEGLGRLAKLLAELQ